MARSDKEDRRRFERTKDEKVWTKEEREIYEQRRAALAPFIRDVTTPAREKKKKGLFEEFGL